MSKFKIDDYIMHTFYRNISILHITNVDKDFYFYDIYNINFNYKDCDSQKISHIDESFHKIPEDELLRLRVGAL
jgi:hypothetical protein